MTANFRGYDAAMALARQADGKFLVAGTAGFLDQRRFGLARFMTNGSLDRSFGARGKVTTDFGPFERGSGHDMAIQLDGMIVVVGGTNVDTGQADFALARYADTGSLDPSFGMSGSSSSPSPSATGVTPGTGPRPHASFWRRGPLLGWLVALAFLLVVSEFVHLLIQRRRRSFLNSGSTHRRGRFT